jgi:UDP-arabinose 4-epimerase
VTGGAGYIGSHAAKALASAGFVPVAYDSLVLGHRSAVRWGPLVEGDIGDKAKLVETIRHYEISDVLHFAAFAYVGESVRRPELYFQNNVTKSLVLLDALMESNVCNIVFSSSCATYGSPSRMPITEDTPQIPVNPYGETKLVIERALRWYGEAHNISCAALRYFNAAGADGDGELGEEHSPETHLIPLVLDAALGRRVIDIYGDDYPTPDGTCVRDYIHVSDLAEAHVSALRYLHAGGTSTALNLGTGNGHSVAEVIRIAERVTGSKIPQRVTNRRPGDPPVLVADPSRAAKILGWEPQLSSLENIVSSAWAWRSTHPGDATVETR